VAEEVIDELNSAGVWNAPIVTEVVPCEVFYPAEDYHQEFYQRNPSQPYCTLVIDPKIAKFREKFRQKLKQPAAG
jgi:peptide-methionine (S)-S-oxide reductase